MHLRRLALAVVLPLTVAACGGGKCDRCSSDSDCDQSRGFVCERYRDDVHRCGDPTQRFDQCPAE